MVNGRASEINEVSRGCIDLEVTKPVAFSKIQPHSKWMEVKKSYKNRVEVEVTADGAETKHLTHLALIAAFCTILMI